MTEQDEIDDKLPKGLLYCFVAIVFALSLAGFLHGVDVDNKTIQAHEPSVEAVETVTDVPKARSYRQMRVSPPNQGSGWEKSVRLANSSPIQVDGKFDGKALEAALARRQKLRAYDGAPPTIPHNVRQNSAAECMACHGEGLKLGQLQATIIPHDNFTNCTQCHVSQDAPMPGVGEIVEDPRDVPNSFEGTRSQPRGPRAWAIAPPQIPHKTFMREQCLSCHGPTGSAAMRSSHTSRQSCTQCHTSSAALDQRPDIGSRP